MTRKQAAKAVLDSLTPAETRMVGAFLKGSAPNAAAAARSAGLSPYSKPSRRLASGDIRQAIQELLADEGFDLKGTIAHLAKLARAKRVQPFGYKGEITYSKPLEALDIQSENVDRILKLHRAYPTAQEAAEDSRVSVGPVAISINIHEGPAPGSVPLQAAAVSVPLALTPPPADPPEIDVTPPREEPTHGAPEPGPGRGRRRGPTPARRADRSVPQPAAYVAGGGGPDASAGGDRPAPRDAGTGQEPGEPPPTRRVAGRGRKRSE